MSGESQEAEILSIKPWILIFLASNYCRKFKGQNNNVPYSPSADHCTVLLALCTTSASGKKVFFPTCRDLPLNVLTSSCTNSPILPHQHSKSKIATCCTLQSRGQLQRSLFLQLQRLILEVSLCNMKGFSQTCASAFTGTGLHEPTLWEQV